MSEAAGITGATGEPVATRTFDEREAPLRAMNESDLWAALHTNMAMLNEVAEAADDIPADTDVAWTRRTMKAPWFADRTTIRLADPDGPATLETDAAARVLLARCARLRRACDRRGRACDRHGIKVRSGRVLDLYMQRLVSVINGSAPPGSETRGTEQPH